MSGVGNVTRDYLQYVSLFELKITHIIFFFFLLKKRGLAVISFQKAKSEKVKNQAFLGQGLFLFSYPTPFWHIIVGKKGAVCVFAEHKAQLHGRKKKRKVFTDKKEEKIEETRISGENAGNRKKR